MPRKKIMLSEKHHKRLHRFYHVGHGTGHLVYFGAVFMEGHGIYATMGGFLLITSLLGIALGEKGG